MEDRANKKVKQEERYMKSDSGSKVNIRNMVLAAMFLALGLVLPFLTGQIRQIGNMLLPMHIPVLLCGLICGWQYGLIIGFIVPLLRSSIFGMPVMFPMAVAMAFELATYGFVIGFVYSHMKKKNVAAVYVSLISAMIAGRIVWGIVDMILLGITGSSLTWAVFISSVLLTAIPGIIIQLILIPAIMAALDRAGFIKFNK